MKVLGKALGQKIGNQFKNELFQEREYHDGTAIKTVSLKLHKLINFLGLSPYQHGQLHHKIHQVSQDSIKPIRFICPSNISCTTKDCHSHISLANRYDEIPIVTLIEGSQLVQNAYVLTGKSNNIKTYIF